MDELSGPSRKFLVVEVDGHAAGYALLHSHEAPSVVAGDNPIELEQLYLVNKFVRHGLGCALMVEGMKESQRGGYDSMWFQVWDRNERAIAEDLALSALVLVQRE